MAREALSYTLAIDWDDDGTYEADEADRLEDWNSRRGRDTLLRIGANGVGLSPGMSAGQVTCTLENSDGRFDPWNSSSPLFGDLQPKRKAYLEVTPAGGSTYRILTGRIADISPVVRHPSRQVKVTLQGFTRDIFDTKVSKAVQADYRTDQAIAALLTEAGWPGGTSLGTGSDTIPYWWGTGAPVGQQIHDLVASEFGLAYEDVNGQFVFVSRHGLLTDAIAFTLTQAEVAGQVQLVSPWELMVKRAEVVAYPRSVQAQSTLWELTEAVPITAGETLTFEGRYAGDDGEAPATDIVTPVSGTDYAINSAAAGTGSDLTGSATVTLTDKGQMGLYEVTNGSATDGWITTLQIRGKLLTVPNATTRYRENSIEGRVLTVDFPWQQDVATAQSYAQWLGGWLSEIPVVPNPVTLRGQWALQFGHDLGTRLQLDLDHLGVLDEFRIGEIVHRSGKTPQDVETLWTLEPIDASRGFVLPAEIPAETRLTY